MKKRITFAYIYFLSRVLFIGFGFSNLYMLSQRDASLSIILGEIISLLFVKLISKIKKMYNNNKLLEKKKEIFLKILYSTLCILIGSELLFIFQTLSSNFFLIKSPNYFILLPAGLLIYRFLKTGWQTVGRVGTILMYISLSMTIILLLTLSSSIKFDNYLPFFTNSITSIFKGSLFYSVYSVTPLLCLIIIPDTEDRLVKYYFLAHLTILFMGLFILGILGPNLINIYRFPEYMILKGIKILNFIEKIDNIFTISTLFDLFMGFCILLNIVKKFLPPKKENFYFLIILSSMFIFSLLLSFNYNISLIFYNLIPFILIILSTLIILTLFIKLKKKY